MSSIPEKQSSEQFSIYPFIASGISGYATANVSFIFEGTKKRLQSNQILPNPFKIGTVPFLREISRGSGSFATCLVPTSILQHIAHDYFDRNNTSTTIYGQIPKGLLAGAIGGIASTIVENVILEQQLKKIGMRKAFFNLGAEGPTRIFRGLSLIMSRESGFGLCYLTVAPQAQKYAKEHFPSYPVIAGYGAGAIVGAGGTLVTHPFDTTATVMQRYGYTNATCAAKHLWKENGVKAFYKGALARYGLFTSAMMTQQASYKWAKEKLDKLSDTPSTPISPAA